MGHEVKFHEPGEFANTQNNMGQLQQHQPVPPNNGNFGSQGANNQQPSTAKPAGAHKDSRHRFAGGKNGKLDIHHEKE